MRLERARILRKEAKELNRYFDLRPIFFAACKTKVESADLPRFASGLYQNLVGTITGRQGIGRTSGLIAAAAIEREMDLVFELVAPTKNCAMITYCLHGLAL